MLSLKTKIITPKWREAADFYRHVFGLTVVEQWDEEGDKGIILAFPGRHDTLLELYDGRGGDLNSISLQFRTDDLGAFVDRLPKGIPSEGPVPRPWGSTYLYLTDPAGISVIVYEGGF